MTPTPTQSQIMQQLRSFLLAVLPATGSDNKPISVIAGQQNRVPEPASGDFVIITPIRRRRLATNLDQLEDVQFTASISGSTMTVTAVEIGELTPGATVYGANVALNTVVVSQQSGTPGGTGIYQVAPSQSVVSEVMGAGAQNYTQSTEIVFQLDVHSANVLDSADMAQVISTLARDSFAVDQFASQVPNYGVVPLHADDPRQVPFYNSAESQWETRWLLEFLVQVNQVVSAPQQAADAIDLDVISVEEAYPS
jgi:hypothetical protein